MVRKKNAVFTVLGGELCAGCYNRRTNFWNPTKDVPVCNQCKNKRVCDLPSKRIWFLKSRAFQSLVMRSPGEAEEVALILIKRMVRSRREEDKAGVTRARKELKTLFLGNKDVRDMLRDLRNSLKGV